MSTSTHQIAVKGVDKTFTAFESIKARAAATGSAIRSAVGGAIAAAGAYLSVRAVAGAVNELGQLSDIAQKTSTSVDELTRATTAMGVLGINMDVNGLAKAFQLMEKNTGRSGLQGFYDTIGELGKIPDTADRAAAAMKVFGRSGMEFMPLINAADETTNALQDVINAMPGIPDAAANACDKAADAMRIGADGIKRIWQRAIGWIVGRFDGDMRVGAAKAVAYLEYNVLKAGRIIRALFTETSEGTWELTEVWKAACEDMLHSLLRTGVIIREFFVKLPLMAKMTFESVAGAALDLLMFDPEEAKHSLTQPWIRWFHELMDDAEKVMEENGIATGYADILRDEITNALNDVDTSDLEKKLEKALENAKKMGESYGRAAFSSLDREAGDLADQIAARSPAIRNDLIMGGSYAALRASINGPQLQNETKKQTAILERIAKNTEKTAENTEESGETYQSTDLS